MERRLVSPTHAQEKQVGLPLNGTHQLLAYTDDVSLLGDNTHTRHEEKRKLQLMLASFV
jgi:hypothetical protein